MVIFGLDLFDCFGAHTYILYLNEPTIYLIPRICHMKGIFAICTFPLVQVIRTDTGTTIRAQISRQVRFWGSIHSQLFMGRHRKPP